MICSLFKVALEEFFYEPRRNLRLAYFLRIHLTGGNSHHLRALHVKRRSAVAARTVELNLSCSRGSLFGLDYPEDAHIHLRTSPGDLLCLGIYDHWVWQLQVTVPLKASVRTAAMKNC